MNVHDRCTPMPGVLRLALPIFFTLFLSAGYAQTITGTILESKKPGYSAETVRLDEIRQNRTVNVMGALEGKVTGSDVSTPSAGAGISTGIHLRDRASMHGYSVFPNVQSPAIPGGWPAWEEMTP
ncbi:hypothetical protein LZZ85_18105 [Terrimonas sp. NA20]|uniref:TonB-dependent receptor n=1 Tax=Terrimonas ginsenosidimutans TaxID=2908004 RepID=A0ABS9KVA9_9BACT|nr:hypothetical protein [Terrimonas ginsenosidimutans]MCG2616217.1 hypothetical protein [Terrimonas ginsenosidimutans]